MRLIIIKIHLIFLLLLILISCTQIKSNKLELKKEIQEIFKDLNINSYIEIKNIKVGKEKNAINEIELVFSKQKIVHPEQQEILFSYLLNESKKLSKLENINFIYYVEGESKLNPKIISYNSNKITKVGKAYQNTTLLSIIKYCLEHFQNTDAYALNKSIEYVSRNLPENTLDYSFFELVSTFSEECFENNSFNDRKASNTLILVYQKEKEFAKEKEYRRIPKILSDIWELCCPEGIDVSSKVFFSSNLSFKSCN